MLLQFAGNPLNQEGPLCFARLLLLFGRHLLKEELLLHFIEQVESCIEGQSIQAIQSDIFLLDLLVMAGEAVSIEQPLDLWRNEEPGRLYLCTSNAWKAGKDRYHCSQE